ncbi:LpqB family beta-propeller domain-containing protein [Schaalia sp. lx-100]|uniref:LpqB family beta-propeller domain-containing protein n=1 Tax=Schaalia sp. lx-100 TaxID=2899081 RepID=UPI001E57BADB|nr:LpqB family beta-propeller domain-containing protein [Schaalia sp. lx-100]MCD4556740.1 LpqB family beta-propeller domain-containing protein [Schaalia sp. lx-100]
MKASTLRYLGVVCITVCAFVVSSCSSLPRAGRPLPFDVKAPVNAPIELVAGGPQEDTTPERLVQDFLLACAAGTSDYFATARLFLTQGSAQKWDPTAHVQIFATDSSPQVSLKEPENMDKTKVVVGAAALASLDDTGVLKRAEGSSVSNTYTLVKEKGQWRIDSPPDGILMSQAAFMASYSRASLYFPAHAGDILVSDPRWYPTRRLASYLLDGLVQGPRADLESVVTNAVPAGTRLESHSVEVSDGIAKVQLEGPAPADAHDQELMQWQIARTLTGVRTISSVKISVSGQTFHDFEMPEDKESAVDSPLVLTAQGIGRLVGGDFRSSPLRGVDPLARAIAVGSTSTSPYAWVSEGELHIVDSTGETERIVPLDEGCAADPRISIDRFGWVWSCGSSAGTLKASHMQDRDVNIPVDVADAGYVRMAAVSAQGSYVVMLREYEGSVGAWLGVVVRDRDGTPREIKNVNVIDGARTGIEDLSWAGEQTIVALQRMQRSGVEETFLLTVDVGGFTQRSSVSSEAVGITAGSSPFALAVLFKDGTYQLRSGALWQSLSTDISLLRYPG